MIPWLRGTGFLLVRTLVAVLLGWLAGARWLLQRLTALSIPPPEKVGRRGREERVSPEPCVPIRHPALQQPDPLIYSQAYLMQLGLAVTWDNPDITLLKNGASVSSAELQPDTEYQVLARIWNGSTEAPVVGMPVHLTLHGFGIGTNGTLIGTTVVDLGVLGGPGCPATAAVSWRTPLVAGHYCIRVTLDWSDDANPNNNVGQENTNVAAAASPARTTFNLRNDDPERRHVFRLEADAYVIPELEECGPEHRGRDLQRRAERAGRRRAAQRGQVVPDTRRRHDRQAHPLPDGWSVEIAPNQVELEAGEERVVEVQVTPPDGFTGRQVLNINGFHEAGLAGGVTLLITKP